MISLSNTLAVLDSSMRHNSELFQPTNWQSINVSQMPGSQMRECLNVAFVANLSGIEDLDHYREVLKPNLPWADEHFKQERISGRPLNPGTTWKTWPWGNSADKFRTQLGKFSHSYAERFWPKYAHAVCDEDLPPYDFAPLEGIRFKYGDLSDVILHLADDPDTRQAYLPIWFPEDTGVVHKERVPCTLGYWFVVRNGRMHMHYAIRSCDFFRHLRDDIYLAIRLELYILKVLREIDPDKWSQVLPGDFSMWIGSLHLFINDYHRLYSRTTK